MLNELLRPSPKEIILWSDSMWPLKPTFFDEFPEILRPTEQEMQSFQYPWQVLEFIQKKLTDMITETHIDPSVRFSKSVEINGPVWIEKGAKVLSFADIVGPVYIGEGVLIGNHTHIRNSFVGARTEAGERTSLVRTVVGTDCLLHQNYLGDTLLMDHVSMGGGGKTANLRTDHATVKSMIHGVRTDTLLPKLGAIVGSGAKFGADWLTMPGVKIGENAIVGPKTMISKDLADNIRCMAVETHTVEQTRL